MKRLLIASVPIILVIFTLYVSAMLPLVPVTRVIDGDTLELSNGERVRLLGIDTPERGQAYYEEAKDWLASIAENQPVRMESGAEDRDKYNRLLRHIFIGETHLNLELVRLGLARAYMIEPGEPYYQDIMDAELLARQSGLGIWAYPESDFCISIQDFRYNAEGDDRENINSEYVTFRNKCDEPLEITGLIVSDESNTTYTFPNLTLGPKENVTLYSGKGEDSDGSLYWGRGIPVWNNQGDTLLVRNQLGVIFINYTYVY